jgi:UDPglucose 6-dehydrogenase
LVEADPIGSMRKADRIVVGAGITKSRVLQNIMQKVTPGAPVAVVSPEEAVMVKLASNGLLAAKVAIANELSEICELYGVDWDNVRGAVGLDRRIGPDHLHVTEERGYGGSCFPKDVQGLIGAAKDKGGRAAAFEVIQSTNEQRRRAAADAMYFMSSVGFR